MNEWQNRPLLCTGAYTVSYSSVGFNGFRPLDCRCVDSADAVGV